MAGIVFLLLRVIASPVVNVFQKRLTNKGVNPLFIVLVVYIFFSLCAVIYLFISGFGHFSREFWVLMIILGITDALGNAFLVISLKNIDLSVFGPMNAYKPVIALVLSVFMLHEIPSATGVIGVAIIIAGSYFLNLQKGGNSVSFRKFLSSRGIIYRFLSIGFTSVAAVILKKVILLSNPLITLSYWSLVGMPFLLIAYLASRPGRYKTDSVSIPDYTGLLIAFMVLQVFSLYTFKYIYVGYSLALFQLSSVISVFFGSRVFREQNTRNRYLASFIMVAGAAVIIIFG